MNLKLPEVSRVRSCRWPASVSWNALPDLGVLIFNGGLLAHKEECCRLARARLLRCCVVMNELGLPKAAGSRGCQQSDAAGHLMPVQHLAYSNGHTMER